MRYVTLLLTWVFFSDYFALASNDLSAAAFGSDNKPNQPLHFQFSKCEFDKAEIRVKRAFLAHWVMKKSDENKPESLGEPVTML